ncbi:glutathione S-transferase family protein [Photobacterium angustum]|uniref:Glutathione S-transferase family protein n=1 Tax=Photobacterium angustum TaxID=661 RepID=A0A855SF61_PHOAN|nr:glutathione S-transferase family protein [Photobacterium angustum]KJF83389.1 glutathione S-transferase [Photobacterium damselae subsp. damselae]KJG03141.1 glutathione S-transferase [Photobacterium angustum]KJG42752.1 glutathione S-transferase [Photobacterium angustum]KJG47697.1 glutathione S-transferase [Photobacterium angustum]KJG50048.1 glutathione S-transferase [Photobacterium angustum]
MVVYGDLQSGNCLKVKLILSLLGIEHQWHHINILENETHTPEFLALNPNGKIPVVVFDDGRVLSESNAILSYFAEGSEYLPQDNFLKAKVYQWLFFEQYSHEPYIAVARYIQVYLGMPADRVEQYEALHEKGYKALDVMEQQLSKSNFLVGDNVTIADFALYAYTHVADDGGYDLRGYPHIKRWLKAVGQLHASVDMEEAV